MKKCILMMIVLMIIVLSNYQIYALATAQNQAHSDKQNLWLFQLANCKPPCFLGLTVGKTSYEDAKHILSTYPLPEGYSFNVSERVNSGLGEFLDVKLLFPNTLSTLQIWIRFIEHKAIFISVESATPDNPQMPTVKEIVTAFGVPDCSISDGGSGIGQTFMPFIKGHDTWTMDVQVTLYTRNYAKKKPVQWTDYADSITIYYHEPSPDTFCGQCYWQGIDHHDYYSSCNP